MAGATCTGCSLVRGAGEGEGVGPRMPAFTGRFDELTGELDVVDLTNPRYECRVRLLEVD